MLHLKGSSKNKPLTRDSRSSAGWASTAMVSPLPPEAANRVRRRLLAQVVPPSKDEAETEGASANLTANALISA